MSFAIDIAWDRPTTAQIKATGAVGVLRYFSTDSTKNLTAAEVADYHANGLGVADVWETTETRATQGYQAGVDDANLAEGQRAADGLPAGAPIYFAVDTDTDWASVADYFRGTHDVLGNDAAGIPRSGVYGGLAVINGAHAAGFRRLWQTVAWSGGVRSPYAVLYQNGSTVLGGNADVNDILAADWGQYPSPNAGGDIVLDAPTAAQIKQLAADGVWGHTETDADNNQPVRMGAVMAWMDRIHHNQSNAIGALATSLTALSTSVGAIATAVAKLGTEDAALLADLQAAQTALAGIPAQIQAALADGTVHVDVSVTGPAPTGA